MRNTVAALVVARSSGAPVYTDFYSARALEILGRDAVTPAVLFHADFKHGTWRLPVEPQSLGGAYVLIDRQLCKIYTSTYNIPLPQPLSDPPKHWRQVWAHNAYPIDGVERRALAGIRWLALRVPSNGISSRIIRNIDDTIDGDSAALYYVPRT